MSPMIAVRTRRALKPRRRALRFEALEPRTLLSAVNWTGAGDGTSWTDASNWSGHAVPGANDDVTISAAGNPTVAITSGGQSVHSLTSADPLSISGGSLTVAANSSLTGGLTMTGGALAANGTGVTLTVTGPTSISGASLFAHGGATLSLPNLTSYASSGTFEAAGAGSVLNVPALTTVTQQGGWAVNALSGGAVNLSGLTSLTSTRGISITDTGGSSILDGNLTTLTGVNVTLDGTDPHVADSWTKFLAGGLLVNTAAYSLPGLTDVDQSSLYAHNGGSLTLPNITTYASNGTFEALGAGSTLNVPALTTVTQQQGGWTVNALGGGQVNLLGLTSLTSTRGIAITDTGGSSILDGNLTALTGVGVTLDGTDTDVANSWTKFLAGSLNIGIGAYTLPGLTDVDQSNVLVNNGGSLTLPNVTSYVPNGTALVAQNGSTLSLPALTAGSLVLTHGQSVTVQGTLISMPTNGTTGAVINVPQSSALVVTLRNTGTFSGGTTFNVGGGTTVELAGGTYLGGATFNVAEGATVDLTGGGSVTYGGTLTGLGQGTVLLSQGGVHPAAGSGGGPGGAGLTLNFTGSQFQWTGGAFFSALGDVTNLGTVNLAGSSDKGFYEDGTFYNEGTLIQTGSGNLGLHSDNISPTTFVNDSGASYLIASDSGINNPSGGQVAVQNAGITRKTAGAGISNLGINGPISNTGTIEADSGTLFINAKAVSQVSGGTLTAGTWSALNGATLQFPTGTSITTNAATVTLDGAGAAIAALAGLTFNSGTLNLTNGADLATTGNFTNSGTLTLGAGSTLDVSGNATFTASSKLDVQIGGTPASGQFGTMAVTGAATLAGTFNLALVGGFTPSAGQDFKVMTFAQANGNFTTFTGLSPSFTQTLNPGSLDLVTAAAPADLAATSVSAPTSAAAGQSITVNWQVTDRGSQPISGASQDSVYLSPTPTLTAGAVRLGSVTHTGGLAAGASYSASLTAAVPAMSPGFEYVIVQVDSLYQVPDTNRANNILAAGTGLLNVSVPALTLGTPVTGAFTAANQDQYYQVNVPAGGSLQVALTSLAPSGTLTLCISQGTLPTPYSFQVASTTANRPNQTATVPQVVAPGTYYILVHSVAGVAASAGYTLKATQTNAFTVSTTSPSSGGNAGNVTLEVDGTNFTPNTTATLTLGGTTLSASAIDFESASRLYATFNLKGAAPGGYTLKVNQGGTSVTAPGAFQVTAPPTGGLNLVLQTPQFVRSGRTATLVVSYSNTSSNDIAAPLLTIVSTNPNVLFSTPDNPNDFVASAQVLAVAPSGPAGVLRAGQTGLLTITLLSNDTIDGDTIPVQVNSITPGQMMNWGAAKTALQPGTFSAAAWDAVWSNVMSTVGTTTDSYNAALDQAATYLASLGATPAQASNVARLWSFLVAQANATFPTSNLSTAVDASLPTPGSLSLSIDRTFVSSIAGRSQLGLFGPGWVTSWQKSLHVDPSGNVTINTGGALGVFIKQANGAYLNTGGEYGTLTQSGGVYTFTNRSGTQFVFLPNGRLNYEQDSNGNRITLGYNAQNQLASLIDSNPSDPAQPSEQLTLSYNAQGLVSLVADGTGNTWSYQYDSTGHLLSVTAPGNLVTSYTYDTGSNPQTAGALLSVTSPDGAQRTFTYDARGRLSVAGQNGGANAVTYTYPGQAEVTATDAAGNQSTVWHNDLGLPARVEDARGYVSTYLYDNNGNLVTATDAAGGTYQYMYDNNGNRAQIVNPLGQTVRMTYGALSKLTSITDAGGNTTQYSYYATGNAPTITYPDGTEASFHYDPLGNLTDTIAQNGDLVKFEVNALGLVTKKTFADGTSQSFTYDARGNLHTVTDASGVTTLTFNAANQLASISYPNGLSLTFTYNT